MNYNFKNFYFLVFIFTFSFSLFHFNIARAAQIYFEPATQKLGIGQEFEITIFLNTEKENINAIEGNLFFLDDILEFKNIREGGSIIDLWIEKPKIENTQKGKISFAGIISAGYSGKKGKIFSLIFRTKNNLPVNKDELEGLIEIRDLKVLLSDNFGTKTESQIFNFKFLLSRGQPVYEFTSIKDQIPPAFFKPEIISDPLIFNGKYSLIFSARDKESGIDYFQVKEGKKSFVKAESPYLLKNQGLYDEIIVRAIDKAGNIRETGIAPFKKRPFYLNLTFWMLSTFFLVVLCIGVWLYKNFRFLFFLSLLIFLFSIAFRAEAASLYFSPSSGEYNIDSFLTTTLYVSSSVQSLNAVKANVNFPKDKLEIVNFSKENSILNLWIQEPTGSNIDGIIELTGISLNPGFIGPSGKIISFVFRVKESGQAALTISNASVLANDGFGTEILTGASGAQFTLLPLPESIGPIQAPASEEKISPPEFKLEIKPKIPPKPSIPSPAPETEIKPEIETTTAIEMVIKPTEPLAPFRIKFTEILKSYLFAIIGFIVLIFASLIIFYRYRRKK